MTPTVLDSRQTAQRLGVSEATIRNWVKHEYLREIDQRNTSRVFFAVSDVSILEQKIKNNEIDRLLSRANKKNSEKTFIPDEYLQNKEDILHIEAILRKIHELSLDISTALFVMAVSLCKKQGIFSQNNFQEILDFLEHKNSDRQIFRELYQWNKSLSNFQPSEHFNSLLYLTIPDQKDILGVIYQSLLAEGEKSQKGSYYTPKEIVQNIGDEYVTEEMKVLDPCCGTGQFLLCFAQKIQNPENIFGVDIDEIAVKIARINLLLEYKDQDFNPNIFRKDSIFDIETNTLFSLDESEFSDFDFIATNPPWGLHFDITHKEQLKILYPELSSFESFSYILKKSIELLNENGKISFILPESILNVGTHKDIRKYILEHTSLKKISFLNRVFKNVFTPVIRLDLQKEKIKNSHYAIQKGNKEYSYSTEKIWNDQNLTFQIHSNEGEVTLIEKIYSFPHTTLKGNADFALGIVTGDNKKYLSSHKEAGYEEIFKGKDIEKFHLKTAENFIHFEPENFQQIAPTKKYRTPEKLIYRFISKNLVFAYDNQQKLTLNSANIVIPQVKNYPIKVILGLFNSSLYNFLFQKKCNSIKVLRSHLEALPLPLFEQAVFDTIESKVNDILERKGSIESLDDYIFSLFSLSEEEIALIKNIL